VEEWVRGGSRRCVSEEVIMEQLWSELLRLCISKGRTRKVLSSIRISRVVISGLLCPPRQPRPTREPYYSGLTNLTGLLPSLDGVVQNLMDPTLFDSAMRLLQPGMYAVHLCSAYFSTTI